MKTTNRAQTVKQLLQILGIVFIFLLTLNSCDWFENDEEPEDVLPPITQTGENTFGCNIDGELLIPKDGNRTWTPGPIYKGLKAQYNESILKVYVGNASDETFRHIYIYIYNLNEEGVYELGNANDAFEEYPYTGLVDLRYHLPNIKYNFSAIEKKNDEGVKKDHYYSYENTGSVTITRFDPEYRVFSGTFSFKAINRDDPADIIEITDGRFDINLNTLNK